MARAPLSNLPEELVKEMLTNLCDKESWSALAKTNTRFKALMHHPQLLLNHASAYWLQSRVDEANEEHAMHFYKLAGGHGAVEGMLMYGEWRRMAKDDEAAEQLFRSALAQEGVVQDETHFIVFDSPSNAFAGGRYSLAHLLLARCEEDETCPEATSLLQSIIESGPSAEKATCSYTAAVVALARMTATGRTGAPASLQGALAIVAAVAEPDGSCHCLMGGIHKNMMDESGGVEALTAHAHFVKALELGDGDAASFLGDLYKSNRGIPEAHRNEHLFIAHLCVVAAALHYREPRAISFMEQLEWMDSLAGPGHPQVTLWARVKAWAYERMGEWMDVGPGGTGTMDLVGALATFDRAP